MSTDPSFEDQRHSSISPQSGQLIKPQLLLVILVVVVALTGSSLLHCTSSFSYLLLIVDGFILCFTDFVPDKTV